MPKVAIWSTSAVPKPPAWMGFWGPSKGDPFLTISDIPSFCDKGGAIGFTTERNRVRYIVNTDTLRQSELKANAKFLQLASETISSSPESDEEVTSAEGVQYEAKFLFSMHRAGQIGLNYLALTR